MTSSAYEQLAEIRALVESARSMPMSSSAVIQRSDMLQQLDSLKATLEQAFAAAEAVTADRDRHIAQGAAEAEQIVHDAEQRREVLVSESEVYRLAQTEARKIVEGAREDADGLRRETDDYIDERLGNFEFTLTKTLESVARGRERLQGRSALSAIGDESAGDESDPGATSGSSGRDSSGGSDSSGGAGHWAGGGGRDEGGALGGPNTVAPLSVKATDSSAGRTGEPTADPATAEDVRSIGRHSAPPVR